MMLSDRPSSETMSESSTNQFSGRSLAILKAISEGLSYDQIVSRVSDVTYNDIFVAAAEAVSLATRAEAQGQDYRERLKRIRQTSPRAYEKWSAEEEARLEELFKSGAHVRYIARELQRQPGAISSRLTKLGLVKPN